jgi:hypothetical protein
MFKKHPIFTIILGILALWLFGGFIFGAIWTLAKWALIIVVVVGVFGWLKKKFGSGS